MTPRVREILGWYGADNIGVLAEERALSVTGSLHHGAGINRLPFVRGSVVAGLAQRRDPLRQLRR